MKITTRLIIGLLGALLVAVSVIAVNQRATVREQQEIISQLTKTVKEVSDVKAIQLAIHPHIENKVTTAFGSSKNVVLQYYFTIDGNSLLVKPDSIYELTKIQ